MKIKLFILSLVITASAQAQIIVTNSSSAQSFPNSVTCTFPSNTYTAGYTYYLFSITTRSGGGTPSDDPTISSGALTVQKVASFAGSFDDRIICYKTVVTSTTTTAITLTYAESQAAHVRITYRVQGNYAEEVQSASATSADPSLTFSSAASASYIFAGKNNRSPFGGAPESADWSEWSDSGLGSIGRYGLLANAISDNTLTITATSSSWTAMGIQFKPPPVQRIIQSN